MTVMPRRRSLLLVPAALLALLPGCGGDEGQTVGLYQMRSGAPLRVPYYCEGAPGIAVTFRDEDVVVERAGEQPLTLAQRETASGFWYHAPGYEVRGKAYELYWSEGTARPVRCTAYGPRKQRVL